MLTGQVWKEALEKWGKGGNHDGTCSFCSMFLLNSCIGCPLNIGEWDDRTKIIGRCCNPKHPWAKWNSDNSEANALAVHDFIATKYIEWLEKNCDKKEGRKPKWAKTDSVGQHSTKPGKWYRILGKDYKDYYLIDEEGDRRYPSGWEWWDICYDDVPPEIRCEKCGQVIKEEK